MGFVVGKGPKFFGYGGVLVGVLVNRGHKGGGSPFLSSSSLSVSGDGVSATGIVCGPGYLRGGKHRGGVVSPPRRAQ